MKIAPTPDGTNTNTASGEASRTRCRNGAKSGLRNGTRSSAGTCPPSAVNRFLNVVSASMPGPKSVTSVTTFLMPACHAQLASGLVTCGSVNPARTTNGDCSVIDEVAAAITTSGIFACVAMGTVASASGVRPKPARIATLSLTTSSCAMRRVVSAVPASSLRITSIFLPATMLPFCCIHSLTAPSIWRPVDANGPVIGRIRPILTVSCATAAPANSEAANATAASNRLYMVPP